MARVLTTPFCSPGLEPEQHMQFSILDPLFHVYAPPQAMKPVSPALNEGAQLWLWKVSEGSSSCFTEVWLLAIPEFPRLFRTLRECFPFSLLPPHNTKFIEQIWVAFQNWQSKELSRKQPLRINLAKERCCVEGNLIVWLYFHDITWSN